MCLGAERADLTNLGQPPGKNMEQHPALKALFTFQEW
jgi:hypothetical protein